MGGGARAPCVHPQVVTMPAFFLSRESWEMPRKPLTPEEQAQKARESAADAAYAEQEEALRRRLEVEHGVTFEADWDGTAWYARVRNGEYA